MALTILALNVPTSDGVGTASSAQALAPDKNFVFDGSMGSGEVLIIEATEDATGVSGWNGVVSVTAIPVRIPAVHVAAFYRVRRRFVNSTSAPTVSVAASGAGNLGIFTVLPVPTPVVGGAAISSAVDVGTSAGSQISFTLEGSLGVGEQIVVEGSQDGVTSWTGVAVIDGLSPVTQILGFNFLRIERRNCSGRALTVFAGAASSASGIIVPTDWTDYAAYFMLSKVPQLKGQARLTDFDQKVHGGVLADNIDWNATGSVQFPGQDTGGTVDLQTSFTAATFQVAGTAFPATPGITDMYVQSMLIEPWAVASRCMCQTLTANTRVAFLSIMADPIFQTRLCVGMDGPTSTAFFSVWYMTGDNIVSVLPVITTIPYRGNGVYHETYMTYNGNNAQIWGGGDYQEGVEPFLGGQFGEFSVVTIQACSPGIGIQSLNGATLEIMHGGTLLGKCLLVR